MFFFLHHVLMFFFRHIFSVFIIIYIFNHTLMQLLSYFHYLLFFIVTIKIFFFQYLLHCIMSQVIIMFVMHAKKVSCFISSSITTTITSGIPVSNQCMHTTRVVVKISKRQGIHCLYFLLATLDG